MAFKFHKDAVRNVGPKEAKIWIVSICPSQQDHKSGFAFSSGTAWIMREAFDNTPVRMKAARCVHMVPHLPPLGKVENWLVPKKDIPNEYKEYTHILGPVGNKYFDPDILPWVAELQADLEKYRPNVIVALGPEVSRILIGDHKIGSARGSLHDCQIAPGIKVIPTYKPSSCFANASLQPIFRADIDKAVRESAYPERRLKPRHVYVAESLSDIYQFRDTYGTSAATVDIETVPSRKQITDVGIAYSDDRVLVIPILDKSKEDYSYWSASDEFRVWDFIREVLADPDVEIRGQGYVYDATWLYDLLLIPSMEYRGDSLVLHHALYPEMPKDLGFLASLYCDEIAWKGIVSFKAAKDK